MPLSIRAWHVRFARAGLAVALSAPLAACSGGGATSTPVVSGPAGTGASKPQSAARTPVAFTMHWTAAVPATSARRAPAYVPATARSVSVAVNGGVAQYLNSPATTLTIDAPIGTDTFVFTLYDEQNGLGNVLAKANITQSIVAGAANTVGATLNGVVTGVKIALSNAAPNAGVPATVDVAISALDADGNVIVGPGDYSTPILLSTSIPASSETGSLSLSRTAIANPAQTATLTYTGSTLTSASVIASATGITSATAVFTPTPTFYQFSIPGATDRPQWIAAGSDGNMWFTQSPGGTVARITPAGVVTAFAVPTANAQPQHIIAASDGNLWFTEYSNSPSPGTSKIAKLTTTGTFTEYSTLFAPPPADNPAGLVDRGDGTIWYVANGSSRVGFQGVSSGIAGETTIPTESSGPFDIAAGPDNNLYYTEQGTSKIGRISNLFSTQSEISLTASANPAGIVRGPDGNLWFTESGSSKIARLSPSSFSVTGEFPTLTPNALPIGIVVGQDGALWFTEQAQDKIGRITTSGTVTEYTTPVTGLGLTGIAVAPDGSLYFCEPGTGLNAGRVGRLVY